MQAQKKKYKLNNIEDDLNDLRTRIRTSLNQENKIQLGKFLLVQRLGGGSYGDVYKAIHLQNKQLFAVKIIDKKKIIDGQQDLKVKQILKALLKTEGLLMQMCKSKYVLKCYQIIQNSNYKIFILQYCNRMSLHDELKQRQSFPVGQALTILKQMILGLSELHKNKIIHRDLKTQNILIDNGTYKIADFGLSKQIDSEDTIGNFTILGTKTTMAPQVMQRMKYGVKADIWSLGIIFYTMICSNIKYSYLFYTGRAKDIRQQVREKKQKFFFQTMDGIPDQELQSFLKSMLTQNQDKRLSWRQLVNHKIFRRCSQLPDNPLENPDIPEEGTTIQINQFQQQHEQNIKHISLQKQKDEKNRIVSVKNRQTKNSDKKQQQPRHSRDYVTVQQQIQNQIEDTILLHIHNKTQSNSIIQSVQSALTETKVADKIYQQIQINNLECKKAEFIFNEIILKIIDNEMLDTKRKSHVQLLYMLITRCFFNLSWAKNTLEEHAQDQMLLNHYYHIQTLYRNVSIQFEQIAKQLTEKQNSWFYIFVQKKDSLFKGKNSNDIFLEGIQGEDFTKQDQIERTQFHYINQRINELKRHEECSKAIFQYVKRNLKAYKKINQITLQQIRSSNKSFKDYVFKLIKDC